ncbi:protein-disulfide reductase DsbD [Basfia succiniciproducens]|uniref:Thiol:disulfide interchange protein DsbD n=1 Tax=Basfia succiniciproducens TaxID=653940 RepID=A0A1G5AHQ4_9PAST|nr:protein-disulfide reductase DsbD [Basfia succiniciproducens]QIM68629.1 protein-disulfide reductase DsbD [Basfia succiniciproducens]SCX77389.1 Thiol:disulfide interchange protein DsbD [Basfia succiniciproducens]
MRNFLLFLILSLTTFVAHSGLFTGKPQFLKPHEAFILSANKQDAQINLHWKIADNYYLYKKELRITGENSKIGEIIYPQADKHQDEFFGETEIFRHELFLAVPVNEQNAASRLEVTYQGCTKGFCYPPETTVLELASLPIGQESQTLTAQDSLSQNLLKSKYAVFGFFLLGIGLAFTPCVLPMLPLLSAIVIGQGKRASTGRALLLSFVYVQGMALTYTLLGLIVAAIGLPFQVALQSPYVLVTLSAVFVLLALSMFGLFNLQLPSSLQTKLALFSQKQQSGALGGVFIMGMIAGLIASPCTSAPLSGALLYVAQTGDLFFGAITLYLLALGMGMPLVLITVFGNRILPKSGAWMEKVKTAFGFVLLALPVFLLARVLPGMWENLLWSLLTVSFFAWLSFSMPKGKLGRSLRILFLILAMIAVRPLQNFIWGDYSAPAGNPQSAVEKSEISSSTRFKQINNYAQLKQALTSNPKAIAMLDLYADWCVACKEFEKYTFSHPDVKHKFEQVLLLQVDMTKNSPENAELMEKLSVLGLPTIIFFDRQGNEIVNSRITGFLNAKQFLSLIEKYL